MLIELFITAILTGSPAGDINRDGVTDGRDVQAYVSQTIAAPAPATRPTAPRDVLSDIEKLKSHPHYLDVLNTLAARLRWPADKPPETPEGMLALIAACAQWEAFTGEWPRPTETLPILRKFRDTWPPAFANFDHQLTLWHIRTMYIAAKLSPRVRAEFEIPLRWIESRMLEPQLIRKPPTAIYSTSPGSGLRDMVMIRELLYGEDSAREVALNGFGTDPTQWGLLMLLDKGFDENGLNNFNGAAFGHIAWTARPALVWLIEVKGYKRYLSPEQRAKWVKIRRMPCRLLCVGGKSFTIPNVNDQYADNPIVGPIWAWTGDTQIDKWARWHARRQSSPTIDWLLVPADEPGYTPPERPPGCSGDREVGRVKLFEDKAGTATRIEYVGDGVQIHGGHKVGRSLTLEVRR